MFGSIERSPEPVHPHARLVARRWGLPEHQLAYLDDPDDIDEVAEILLRRRKRRRQRHLRLYWTAFYGGTGILLIAGLLISVLLLGVAALWFLVLVGLGLVFLKPID